MTRSPTVAHERPILFSAAMVRAILDGRKTQTRRVLKPQPVTSPGRLTGPWQDSDGRWGMMATEWRYSERLGNYEPERETFLPFKVAAVGDCLWVRETWSGPYRMGDIPPRDWQPGLPIWYWADGNPDDGDWCRPRPAIHMPRWASRITLEVTDVRVQRLQDISEEDALAEGATSRPNCSGFRDAYPGWSMDWSQVGRPSRFARDGKCLSESDVSLGSAVSAFAGFVNELRDPKWNLKGDGIFGANPWVVAITFRRIDQAGGGHG